MNFGFSIKNHSCVGGYAFTLALIVFAFVVQAGAICSDPNSPLAALIRSGDDDGKRIPLLMIHGKGGTSSDARVDAKSQTWSEFIRIFNEQSNGLKAKYSLYLFQYCSDRKSVAAIASSLRDLIDDKLKDRDHVIVGHSLGGLIAKSYMAQTEHKQGNWKGKKGGDTTLQLITLATPHHGTPGANDPATFRDLVPEKYKGAFGALQNIYWLSKKTDRLAVLSPAAANRSDLRWDNYDGKINASSADINVELSGLNTDFEPFNSKLIAYGGIAPADLTTLELAAMMIEAQIVNDNLVRQHRMLAFANMGLVYGFGRRFGDADGLVPFVSALDCRQTPAPRVRVHSYVCVSDSRVRRFETGSKPGEAPASELPDQNTLSIFRSVTGFDHLDMLASPHVIHYVIKDLEPGNEKPLLKK